MTSVAKGTGAAGGEGAPPSGWSIALETSYLASSVLCETASSLRGARASAGTAISRESNGEKILKPPPHPTPGAACAPAYCAPRGSVFTN